MLGFSALYFSLREGGGMRTWRVCVWGEDHEMGMVPYALFRVHGKSLG